jgi:hypothetical protein
MGLLEEGSDVLDVGVIDLIEAVTQILYKDGCKQMTGDKYPELETSTDKRHGQWDHGVAKECPVRGG